MRKLHVLCACPAHTIPSTIVARLTLCQTAPPSTHTHAYTLPACPPPPTDAPHAPHARAACRRSLFKLALDVARAVGTDAATLASIHTRWGDHLYEKVGVGVHKHTQGLYVSLIKFHLRADSWRGGSVV